MWMEERWEAHTGFVWETEEKRPLRRSRPKLEDDIHKMIQGIWWGMKLIGFGQVKCSGEPFLTQKSTIGI